MGQFAFEIPTDAPAAWYHAIAGAWLLNGYDHWPISCERSEFGNVFQLKRSAKESAMLALLAPDASGQRTISTSTLRSNAPPYRILVELARGTLNRLRNLVEALSGSNIPIPVEHEGNVRSYTADFGKAIAGEREVQQQLCTAVIGQTLATSDALMTYLAEQRLRASVEDSPGLRTHFGCVLRTPLTEKESQAYCSIFNAVQIHPAWAAVEANESRFDWSAMDRLVEWATVNRLAITIGPIIDFSSGGMPAWLYQQSDLPLLAAFMDDFLGTVVARYRRHSPSFQVFAGLNSNEEFELIEDDRLRLAARLLESALQIDPQLRWSYLLREPFGDYLRNGQNNYSPLVFADTLLRSGNETAMLGLDTDSGSAHDALDLLPMLDHFSSLGPKLTIECGGQRTLRTSALTASLLQTALSCEPVEAVTWSSWSREQSPHCSESSILFEGELTPLGLEFQILRMRWWPAPSATP